MKRFNQYVNTNIIVPPSYYTEKYWVFNMQTKGTYIYSFQIIVIL